MPIYKTANEAERGVRQRGQAISTGDYMPGDFYRAATGKDYVIGELAAQATREMDERRRGVRAPVSAVPQDPVKAAVATAPAPQAPAEESPVIRQLRESVGRYYETQGSEATAPQQQGGGSLIGDAGRAVMGGLVNLGGGVYELGNIVTGGGLDSATKSAFGTSGSQVVADARDYWRSGESAELKAQRAELEKADGFFDSFKTIITNPRLAGAMTLEMLPQLVTVAGAARMVAAKTLAGAAKAGMTAEAAQAAAATNATRTVLGLNAAMEGGAAGQDARQTVMTMSEAELDQSPQYQALVKQYGDTPEGRNEARLRLANDASMFAAAIAAPISLISNKITGAGALESKVFTKSIVGAAGEGAEATGKRTALGVAKDIAVAGGKEIPQEAIEEGGSQFGTNVGLKGSGAKPDQDLMEGVGAAAGAGGALGLIAGAGFGTMGQARTALSGKDDTAPKGDAPPAGTQSQDDIRKAMSDAEYGAAVNSAPLMAAAYARADEATRARLRAANPDLNFDDLMQDEKTMKVGSSLIDNNPSFFEAFNARLPQVSEEKSPASETATSEPPFDPDTPSDVPGDRIPMRERMRVAEGLADEGMAEAEGRFSRSKPAAAPAPESLNAGPEVQIPGLPPQDVLIRGYQRRAENIMSMPEGARAAAATSSMQEMISRGFTPEQAQSVFGRVTQPQVDPAQVEEIEAAAPPQDTSLDFTQEDIRPKLDPNFVTFDQVRQRLAQKDLGREPTAKVTDYIETPVPPQIRELAKRFGVQVYGFRYAGNNKLLRTRQGASLSGGAIVLNADAQNSHLSIFGHELYHELRRRNPEAAAQLEQEILSYVTQPGKERLADKLLKVGYDISKIDEEMTADLMGVMFSEREFWAELGQKQPTLLEKIIQVIDDMLAKFGDLSSRKTAIAKYVTDMQAVRQMLVGFVNESQGGTDLDFTSGSIDENVDVAKNFNSPDKRRNALINYLERFVDEKRRSSPDQFFESAYYGNSPDTDRGVARYIEKHKNELPKPVMDALALENVRDLETGEIINAIDSVRGGHIGQLRRLRDESEIDESIDPTPEQEAVIDRVRSLLRDGKEKEAASLFSKNNLYREVGIKFTDLQKENAQKIAEESEDEAEEATPADLFTDDAIARQIVDHLVNNRPKMAGDLFRTSGIGNRLKITMADLRAQADEQEKVEKRVPKTAVKPETEPQLRLSRNINEFDTEVSRLMSGSSYRSALFTEMLDADAQERDRSRPSRKSQFGDDAGGVFSNFARTGSYGQDGFFEAEQLDQEAAARKAEDDRMVSENARIMRGRVRSILLNQQEKKAPAVEKSEQGKSGDVGIAQSDAIFERELEMDREAKAIAATLSVLPPDVLEAYAKRFEKFEQVEGEKPKFDAAKVFESRMQRLQDIRDRMAKAGFGASEIEATVGPAERAMRELSTNTELARLAAEQIADDTNKVERTTVSAEEPEEAGRTEEQTELDFNDKQRTDARRLVDAIAKKELTFEEALDQIRKNEIGLMHLYDAMREAGLEVKKSQIEISGNVAVNYTLNDYVKKFPTAGLAARNSWLKAYDALPVKSVVKLTSGEEAAYNSWKSEMAALRSRLKEKQGFDNLENAFPNALFLNYTLSEMRDPSKIEEPRRSMIKDLFTDPTRAWFEDIKFVTTARPDLKPQLQNYLTKAEMTAYQEFAERESREARRALDIKMRSPAYSQLDSLRYLSPDLYTSYRQEIAKAEQSQLSVILQKAFEQNELAKSAKESGKDIGETIGAYLTQVISEDENYAKSPDEMSEDDESARYRRGVYSGVVPAMAVQGHFESIFSKWDTPPAYTVAQNPNQLPDDVRARLTSRFATNDFRGAIDPKTGHIYVFSDFVTSVEDAEFTMFHELYGHWGARAFLGDSMNSFLNNQYRLNKRIQAEADRQMEQAKQDGMPMTKLESIEEAIADEATKGNDGPFRQLIGRLVRWLRKHGMNNVADWMDSNGNAELAFVLAQARKVAMSKQGISPLAGAPAQAMYSRKKMPVEMFAIRDGKTTAYARINPVTQQWTVFTMKDPNAPLSQANFSAQSVDEAWEAHDLMKKFGSVTLSRDRDTRKEVDPNNASQIPDFKDLTGWAKFKRNMTIQFQNMFLPIFEVARFLESKGVKNSVIDDLIKYESRLQYYVDDYTRRYATPIQQLLKDIGEKGATMEDVDLFLMARHAEERNAVIKAINPKNTKGSGLSTKDAQKILKSDNDGKWTAYTKELKELGKLIDQMSKDKLGYMLNTGLINKFQYESLMRYDHYVNLSGNKELGLDEYDGSELGGRAFNVAGNDIKRATGRGTMAVDVLQNTMNSYLSTLIRGQKNRPLQAMLNMFEQNPDATYVQVEKINTKKQINVERFNFDKKILKAIGTDRATEAAGKNYLQGLYKRMERGELDSDGAMAELAQRIRLAEERRDIEPEEAARAIRNISEQVVMSARLSPDGYVSTVETQASNKNSVVVKVNGAPVTMSFTGRGIEFFQSITGMNVQQSSGFVDAIGAWNRLFSQMVTTWNPAWVPVNALRDIQTAFANAAADPEVGAELAGKMLKDWKRMHKIAFRHLVADQANAKQGFWGGFLKSRVAKNPLTDEEKALIDEFFKEGGGTFFLDRAGLEQTLDKLNRTMNPAKISGGVKEAAQWTEDKLSGVADLMELFTMPVEMAPRLAAYKVIRDNHIANGMDPAEARSKAARYAKELTVNFNMKGANKQFRALYVFANPAIQGTVRMFQDLKEGNYKRFGAVAGTWMMLGLVGNMIARAMGDDDDDKPGIDKLDMVPNYRRATQFIWAPDTYGGAIPVAYGWNVFMAAGHYLYDSMFGYLKPEEAATRVMTAAFDAFAPIGSGAESQTFAGMVLKTGLPTPMVPIVEMAMNENRFGAPIYKEQSSNSNIKEADAYMHFNSVNPISKWAMQSLAQATSGDRNPRYNSSMIDVNPASVDHFISNYLPGLFSEAYKAAGVAITASQGRDTKEQDIPVISRLRAKVDEESFDSGAFRRVSETVDTRYREYMDGETSNTRRAEILKQYPNIGGIKALFSGTEQQIKSLRQNLTAIDRNPNISDEERVSQRNRIEKMEQEYRRRAIKEALKRGFRDEVIDNSPD